MEKHKYIVIDRSGDLNAVAEFEANPSDINRVGIAPHPEQIKQTKQKLRDNYVLSFFIGAIICAIISIIIFGRDSVALKETQKKLTETELALDDAINNRNYEENILSLIGEYSLAKETGKPQNIDTIYNLAVRAGAYYPEVVVAQAIQESGCGVSNVGKNANNLYGMNKVSETKGHRVTTQIPGRSHGQYGVYHNWQMSTIDRVIWEHCVIKKKPASRREYINQMCNVYCAGNDVYSDLIESVSNDVLKKLNS